MKKKYLTMIGITLTENLGSQMWHFSALYAISRRTGHRILFYEELASRGKVLQLKIPFVDVPFDIEPISGMTDEEKNIAVHKIDRSVSVESKLFAISDTINVNFEGYFHCYKYWYHIRQEILKIYTFKPEIMVKAKEVIAGFPYDGRQKISVHVRRTDYLEWDFLSLQPSYYHAAFAHFDNAASLFLFFSDDIAWCKETFGEMENARFVEGNQPAVDMCAMSLCDHHIIANSSFGFWGAFLNQRPGRRVICPSQYVRTDHEIPCFNNAWFPDDFTPIVV